MPGAELAAGPAPGLSRLRWSCFIAGLLVSLLMAWRAQVGLDQYTLLVRGWMLVDAGWLVPFGAFTAAGGFQPGSLTSLLMGLPLLVWGDYRAIGLLTVVTHVVAYLLLDRALGPVLGSRGRLLLCIFYWLNPWRVFYSAHIWNPTFLFLPAALHLVTAYRSRDHAGFAQTFWHVVAIGAALHLHASFLILAVASLLLLARGFVRVHWGGFLAGSALVTLSLADWMLAVAQNPGLLPIGSNAMSAGVVRLEPILEGVGYWLRYGAAAFSTTMTRFDFTVALGTATNAIAAPTAYIVVRYLAPVTIAIVIAAYVWFVRRRLRVVFARRSANASSLTWLLGYCGFVFFGLLLAFALNPAAHPYGASGTTSWRGFIALHAAVLPVVIWLTLLSRTRARIAVRVGAKAHAALLLVCSLLLAIASPMYRQGGEHAEVTVVDASSRMIDELGLAEHATIVIDPTNGFRSELFRGPEVLTLPPPLPRM